MADCDNSLTVWEYDVYDAKTERDDAVGTVVALWKANLVGSPVAVLREPELMPSKVGPCLRQLGGGGSHGFWFFR
jgi:hypothetical protein